MPEILLKDKLTTLEDIGEALNSNIIVTGVKGSAEGSYRKGKVELTPANIGAVSKTGADTMTGALTISKDSQGYQDRIHFSSPGVSGECIIFGSTTGTVQRFTFRQVNSAGTKYEDYVLPNSAEYNGNSTPRNILTDKNVITIPQGGTGATTKLGACDNIGAVNNATDTSRRFSSGSVNDAPLGLAAFDGSSSNVTQKPYSYWFDVFTFISIESSYARQVALPWFEGKSIAFRIKISGTWSNWRYIATQTTQPTT